MAREALISLDVLINTPYVQLGQLLKIVGLVSAGGQAKVFLQECDVLVNGGIERRRGRKLYANDTVSVKDKKFVVVGGK